MEREANVHYEFNWPFGEKPWPWCHMAGYTKIDGTVVPPTPHDSHMVNEGNTRCPGAPGIVEVPDLITVLHYSNLKMRELVDWLVSLDDPEGPGFEARRTVTLTKIIEKARGTYVERKQ